VLDEGGHEETVFAADCYGSILHAHNKQTFELAKAEIKETATTTPLKETQDLSFKSQYKPRFKGAATNINGTTQQPWSKREGDLDGD
jgi:hypothetical protein